MSKKEQLSEEEIQNSTEQTTEEQEPQAQEIDPIEVAQNETAEWKDKYTRLYAEFDNFRRRTSKERIDLIKNAGKDVLVDLLPLIDDFDRAVNAANDAESIDGVVEGYALIQQKFYKALESKGVKPMNSIGEPFDVEFHEAITNIPAPTEDQKGKVVDVVEKGYFMNDQVLRYAKVVVGQ